MAVELLLRVVGVRRVDQLACWTVWRGERGGAAAIRGVNSGRAEGAATSSSW